MLQSIRERAQGWIAWFIVILISIPFALWGIQEYIGGGTDPVAASVNGEEITERDFEMGYRNFRQNLRARMGANYRPEMLDESVLRKQVLDSMIREELILQAAEGLGLAAGDQLVSSTISTIPSFQMDGQFNNQLYQQAVRSRGLNTQGFEVQVRQSIISGSVPTSIVEFNPILHGSSTSW